MSRAPTRPEHFHVGWICAVQTEYVVACELLDEEFPPLPSRLQHDDNTYTLGRIGQHSLVIACLPKGKYGLSNAASVAKDMIHSFPCIQFGLMVGIAGGAPSAKHDIRLGDVVVSSPTGRTNGVVHYEFGKTMQRQQLHRTGALSAPPMVLLTALNGLDALHERKGHAIAETVQKMLERNPRLAKKYGRPLLASDRLYEAEYLHSDAEKSCDEICVGEHAREVHRKEREAHEPNPIVHYGLIASADRLMKDAVKRDTLSNTEDVLCFEMEAAGLVERFPLLVIRGICDYSDTHKNDIWQGYAAATAAAYAKELLNIIQPTKFPTMSARVTPDVQSSEASEDNALIELWPATPAGEMQVISTTTDIVAIHGLNGHPLDTWTKATKLWLRDFLPGVMPEARILSFGYDSCNAFAAGRSCLRTWVIRLLSAIKQVRSRYNDPKRKIIFVCHNLGGLLFKEAFLMAREQHAQYNSIYTSIAAVIFMGTPHHFGGALAWQQTFNLLAQTTASASSTDATLRCGLSAEDVDAICSRFLKVSRKLHIFTMVETLATDGRDELLITEESAILHARNETCRRLRANHANLCKFASASNQDYLTVVESLLELVEDLEEPVEDPGLNSARTQLLDRLLNVKPETMLQKALPAEDGSCEWLLKTPEFSTWQADRKSQLLWLHGPPGCGKSVMMKFLINHFRAPTQSLNSFLPTSSDSIHQSILFFFGDDKVPGQKTSSSLINSLLYQILHRPENFHLFRYFDQVFDYASMVPHKVPNSETLWQGLSQIAQKARGFKFWVFIDALDEFETSSRIESLAAIANIIGSCPMANVKFLVTSREVTVHSLSHPSLIRYQDIDMNNSNVERDVQRYLQCKTRNLFSKTTVSSQLWKTVEDELFRVSGGTFLNASLALAEFSAGVKYWTRTIIRERLLSLQNRSADLDSFYCRLLRRIPNHFRGQVRQILTWILYSFIPLTFEELHFVVTLNEEHQTLDQVWGDMASSFKEVVFESCGFLVEIDQEGLVCFTHQSVKDFLISQYCPPDYEDVIHFFRVSPGWSHALITTKCLSLMQLRDFSAVGLQQTLTKLSKACGQAESVDYGTRKCLKRYSILVYAMANWSRHITLMSVTDSTTRMISAFITTSLAEYFRVLSGPWTYPSYIRFPWLQTEAVPGHQSCLHHLIVLGDFPQALKDLIEAGHNPNELDASGTSPLQWAIIHNRQSSFQTLMQLDEIDPNLGPPQRHKPIHFCVFWNRPTMLRDVLSHPNIDVNIRGASDKTAMHAAMEHLFPEIVDILLELKGDSIDFMALEDGKRTPLELAYRHETPQTLVAKLIRAADKKHCTRSSNGGCFSGDELMTAGIYGWTDVEQMLLERDPKICLHLDDEGMNVLTRYAFYARKEKVEMLLHSLPKSAIDSSMDWGKYHLAHLCAQQGWEDIYSHLNQNFELASYETDQFGRSVLHWAVDFGWKDIERFCRKISKHHINKQDRDGHTPLHLAIITRNEMAIPILMRYGADYLVKDKQGRNPVHTAADIGFADAVDFFLRTSTQDFGKDRQGVSLLHYMSMWLPSAIIKLYLDSKKPPLNVRDQRRRTSLHYAAIFDNIAAAELLLTRGATVDMKDHVGRTPLHYAIIEGKADIVSLLLQHKSDPTLRDSFKQTCLQMSIRSGDFATIDLISKVDTSIHACDKFGMTALHRACALRDPWPLLKLLSMAPEINAKDNLGFTPLHTAAAHKSYAVVVELLGCPKLKLSERDSLFCTPLDRAIVEDDKHITRLLRDQGARNTHNFRSKLRYLIPYQNTSVEPEWHDWPMTLFHRPEFTWYPKPRIRSSRRWADESERSSGEVLRSAWSRNDISSTRRTPSSRRDEKYGTDREYDPRPQSAARRRREQKSGRTTRWLSGLFQ